MDVVEFLLNDLIPIFSAVLCLLAALKSIEIVKRNDESRFANLNNYKDEEIIKSGKKANDAQCKNKKTGENKKSEEDQELRKKRVS